MTHPLTPDLSNLSMEDLQNKHGDLLKRMTFAYRMGRPELIQQLQMLMDDYQQEIQVRNQKALDEMEKNSKNFKNFIDIK
jgi:hypothetical protein